MGRSGDGNETFYEDGPSLNVGRENLEKSWKRSGKVMEF